MELAELRISSFTSTVKLGLDEKSALKDLFFSGQIPADSPRELYAKLMAKTTICNFIRILYFYFWSADATIKKSIMHMITDAKASVLHLRISKGDTHFDKGWWRAIDVGASLNLLVDNKDPFWNPSSFSRSADISSADLAFADTFIRHFQYSFVRPFCLYAYIDHMIPLVIPQKYCSEVRQVLLTIIHMRLRIENKILQHEDLEISG
jgi:hypothetical protein